MQLCTRLAVSQFDPIPLRDVDEITHPPMGAHSGFLNLT